MIENVTFEEIQIGQQASLSRRLTMSDIELFATVSGDINPAHLDEEYAADSQFHKVIGHGMWSGSLISAVLGTLLPGPGTIYMGQDLRFKRPVGLGDVITVTVTAKEKHSEKNIVVFDCVARNQDGKEVVSGLAEVIAPTRKVRRAAHELPQVQVIRHDGHDELLGKTESLPPVPTAVVHPCDESSLKGAVEAAEANLIDPVLIGPASKIKSVAEAHGLDISRYRIVDVAHSHASAETGVRLARSGECEAVMKGSLHTDELMAEVVRKETGLRTGRRLSHVFVMNVPTYPRTLLITDAAINIYPTLEDKVDIVQNAIDLAKVLGVETPRVAILSAVETVNPKIASTLEAAALCKMADRGQIKGGILDGPLAFDNAISLEAARTKGIVSEVAGQADILLVPDLEAGNMLAKQLSFLANSDAAGIVLGARVPIILTSRADNVRTRLASCAVAVLAAAARRRGAAAAAE
ncbi:bifunctional enoyl-CoA hydratase/phosphate acetyltransferase [Azospirillum brasilense]|uniref:Bifunctional enoyl-CoA hydratase/phosphate acetyltransferase n=2 Tax=Azospirillum brasilense TaxID=192 RepID=A0A4D8QMZ2_AZOBR|nr:MULTISPECIES: bifunctional enoyl-CoA hydratase/phosphate acetyltransferase [Azospirillum]MDW7554031.1 bifunctional enoyl-CoA hydratase/phosphate acetyltransferase [Azospirillum brasilense]MDW7593002.1 bifunctional enoyl-CoA hydratase/phosphate acetyltransferase [Azospirillum brasilense]MDW7593710.1 bifunctional enoyl-CoA hydratase/phosphate acetyltransferase [Azospirillum brasilense]MDW7627047.1 bifunctional enoyl-CoA hydratase/phosphate acetyltransferase [Azospirillum brasilense]MDX5953249